MIDIIKKVKRKKKYNKGLFLYYCKKAVFLLAASPTVTSADLETSREHLVAFVSLWKPSHLKLPAHSRQDKFVLHPLVNEVIQAATS